MAGSGSTSSSMLKTACDPQGRQLGPGVMMQWEMIARAFRERLSSYEFLGEDEPWKLRWTAATRVHVSALDLWSVAHPALAIERFQGVARRRRSTVGLPVHQELSDHDLGLIAMVTASYRSAGGMG